MKSEKSILLSVLLCICLLAPSLSACSRKGTTTEKPSVSATDKGEDATLYPASLFFQARTVDRILATALFFWATPQPII